MLLWNYIFHLQVSTLWFLIKSPTGFHDRVLWYKGLSKLLSPAFFRFSCFFFTNQACYWLACSVSVPVWYVFAALYWKALCQCPPSSASREVMSDTLSRSRNGILTEQRQQEEEELSSDHNILKIHLHPRRIEAYPSQKQREHKVLPSSFLTSSVLAQYEVISILKQVVKDCESWFHPETTYRRHKFIVRRGFNAPDI